MCKYVHTEAELYRYIMNTQKSRFARLIEKLQFKGCRLARTNNVSVTMFKVSYGWVRHFTARHDPTIRCLTMIAQRLPKAYEEKLVSFQKHVLKMRKKHEYIRTNKECC